MGKLKTMKSAAKELAKYLSKPYYSIAKKKFDPGDGANYYAPIVRNIILTLTIEGAEAVATGKLPDFKPNNIQALLLLDSFIEGYAVYNIYNLYDKLKNRKNKKIKPKNDMDVTGFEDEKKSLVVYNSPFEPGRHRRIRP